MYFKYRNTLHTPEICKKIAEIKNIPYFLPVVYIPILFLKIRQKCTISILHIHLPHRGRDKWSLFRRRYFQTHFFLNENVIISIQISLKFVPKGPINNIPALVQIMAWRRPGDKPLSEAMLISLLTHICVTRPQWVKLHIGGSMQWIYHYPPPGHRYVIKKEEKNNKTAAHSRSICQWVQMYELWMLHEMG